VVEQAEGPRGLVRAKTKRSSSGWRLNGEGGIWRDYAVLRDSARFRGFVGKVMRVSER
jgi:hypothetical protein